MKISKYLLITGVALILTTTSVSPQSPMAFNSSALTPGVQLPEPVQRDLQKNAASGLTTYTNNAYNFTHNAPSGWTFSTPIVYSDGLSFTVSNHDC